MRYLMRLNVEKGTAEKAEVRGYYIGGKTGTADKVINGRLFQDRGSDRLHGGAAGRSAALRDADHARRPAGDTGDARLHHLRLERGSAVGGAVVARIAPLLGIEPRLDLPPADQLILASIRESR